MRNRTGIAQRCPTGTDKVGYSNVTKTERGRECGLGRGGHRQGDALTGSLRDNEEFTEPLIHKHEGNELFIGNIW
jgi:hypothetical protein